MSSVAAEQYPIASQTSAATHYYDAHHIAGQAEAQSLDPASGKISIDLLRGKEPDGRNYLRKPLGWTINSTIRTAANRFAPGGDGMWVHAGQSSMASPSNAHSSLGKRPREEDGDMQGYVRYEGHSVTRGRPSKYSSGIVSTHQYPVGRAPYTPYLGTQLWY